MLRPKNRPGRCSDQIERRRHSTALFAFVLCCRDQCLAARLDRGVIAVAVEDPTQPPGRMPRWRTVPWLVHMRILPHRRYHHRFRRGTVGCRATASCSEPLFGRATTVALAAGCRRRHRRHPRIRPNTPPSPSGPPWFQSAMHCAVPSTTAISLVRRAPTPSHGLSLHSPPRHPDQSAALPIAFVWYHCSSRHAVRPRN